MLENINQALLKKDSNIIVKSPTQGSLSTYRKISTRSDFREFGSSQTESRKTRKVTLNIRGKQDPLTQAQLMKNYKPFQTTYTNDYLKCNLVEPNQRFGVKHQERSTTQSQKKTTEIQTRRPNSVFGIQSIPNPKPEPLKEINEKLTQISSLSNTQINLLEQIPPNDPIWADLIPDEIVRDKNLNLEKFVEDNYTYLCNLLGLAFQERMQRDFTLSKLHHSSSTSSYSQEFPNKASQYQHLQLNGKYNEYQTSLQHVDYKTSYQQFFKEQQQPLPVQSCRPKERLQNQYQSLITSYQNNFLKWQPNESSVVKMPFSMSTGNLPLLGKTSYNEQYKAHLLNPSQLQSPKSFGPFLQNKDMMYTSSLNKEAFKPFIVNWQQGQQSEETQDALNVGKTSLQSNSQREFIKHQPENHLTPINNQKVWKQRLIKKLEELRTK